MLREYGILLFCDANTKFCTFLCGLAIHFFHNHVFHVFFCEKCVVFFLNKVELLAATSANLACVTLCLFLRKIARFLDVSRFFMWPRYRLLSQTHFFCFFDTKCALRKCCVSIALFHSVTQTQNFALFLCRGGICLF